MKENAHDMFFGSWYNLEDGMSIKRCYQGKQKSAYGYIWKLKNTQNDR